MATTRDTVRSELRLLRSSGEVNPLRTAALAAIALQNSAALGDDVWLVIEQYAIALLDTGDLCVAKQQTDILEKRFPNSQRVRKLRAMYHEAVGEPAVAMAIYGRILDDCGWDSTIFKRKIAVLKGIGDVPRAISALCVLVDTLPHDAESWLELADLYISQKMLNEAAFCAEEVLLILPTSHFAHHTCARIYRSLDRPALALKHLCRSVELCPSYSAGLYAVVDCCRHMLSIVQSPQDVCFPPRATLLALHERCCRLLLRQYDRLPPTSPGADDSVPVRDALAYLMVQPESQPQPTNT